MASTAKRSWQPLGRRFHGAVVMTCRSGTLGRHDELIARMASDPAARAW
jgi:hypothetical protein